MADLPVIWAFYDKTHDWFVDTDETFVRDTMAVGDRRDIVRIDVPALVGALRAAKGVLWMAERYAEGGGSHGPEMADYEAAEELITAALAALETPTE